MTNELGLLIKGGVIVLLAMLTFGLFITTKSPLSFILLAPAPFVAIWMRNGK